METIGSNIRNIRKSLGMTQEELAKKASLEQTIISRYESRKIIPPIPKLEQIAKAFNVSLDVLVKDGGLK